MTQRLVTQWGTVKLPKWFCDMRDAAPKTKDGQLDKRYPQCRELIKWRENFLSGLARSEMIKQERAA